MWNLEINIYQSKEVGGSNTAMRILIKNWQHLQFLSDTSDVRIFIRLSVEMLLFLFTSAV
jgi:hypothetical protein